MAKLSSACFYILHNRPILKGNHLKKLLKGPVNCGNVKLKVVSDRRACGGWRWQNLFTFGLNKLIHTWVMLDDWSHEKKYWKSKERSWESILLDPPIFSVYCCMLDKQLDLFLDENFDDNGKNFQEQIIILKILWKC